MFDFFITFPSMNRTRFLLLILWAFAGNLWAQNPPTGQLESPYEAVYQHLYYLQSATYRPDLAAEALMPLGDSLTRVKRAIQLKQILDGRGYFVRLERIPHEQEWRDTLTGESRYVLYPLELPEVSVVLVNGRWMYGRSTWEAIPRLHKQVYPLGTDRLLNMFSGRGGKVFLGLFLWQWVGIAGLLLGLYGMYWLIYFMLIPLSRRLLNRLDLYLPEQRQALRNMDRHISLWLVAQLGIIGIPVLTLPAWVNEWLIHGIRIASWVFVLLMGLRLIDLLFTYLERVAAKSDSRTDSQILPILKRGVQVVLGILVLIPILRLLEVNITALIAGLSIGGLALALAAQDTVKNLISTVLIFFDHPYKLGDYIKAAGVEGTVVEIGFRSTRMMTIDSSIITIPNSNMINDQVVNLGVRQFRLIHFFIGVVYSTPADSMDAFIKGMRELAHAHPNTIKENILIYLHELNNSSIDIRFRVPIIVPDLRTDYTVREELVFGIIRLAKDLGVSFAFPSQSIYVETFPGKEQDPASGLPDNWQDVSKGRIEKLIQLWSESRSESPIQ